MPWGHSMIYFEVLCLKNKPIDLGWYIDFDTTTNLMTLHTMRNISNGLRVRLSWCKTSPRARFLSLLSIQHECSTVNDDDNKHLIAPGISRQEAKWLILYVYTYDTQQQCSTTLPIPDTHYTPRTRLHTSYQTTHLVPGRARGVGWSSLVGGQTE